MSERMQRRLSRHIDTKTCVAVCEDEGLSWVICAPTGLGHPKLVVCRGDRRAAYPLSSSPGKPNRKSIRASFRRWLRINGMIEVTA